MEDRSFEQVRELAERLREKRLDKTVLLLMVLFVPSPAIGHSLSVIFAPVLKLLLGEALLQQILLVFDDATLWRALVDELSS